LTREQQAIRSRSNALVQSLRRLGDDADVRDREGSFLADGVRLLEEAVRLGTEIEIALTSPRLRRGERGRALEADLARVAQRMATATDAVVAALVGVPRHQGVVARVRRRPLDAETIFGERAAGAWVVASGIQDPGNLGGLVRAAAAAGTRGLLTLEAGVDPWNPKAVRASAGAIFHLPVLKGLPGPATLERLERSGYVRRAAVAAGGVDYRTVDWRRPTALIIGGEAAGPASELDAGIDERVTIPMADGIESLNVLSAASVLLFEASRHRSSGP